MVRRRGAAPERAISWNIDRRAVVLRSLRIRYSTPKGVRLQLRAAYTYRVQPYSYNNALML